MKVLFAASEAYPFAMSGGLADVAGALKGEGEALEDEKVTALFKKISGREDLKVSYECLKDEKTPALININEQYKYNISCYGKCS